ncbi:hypothetical protein ABD78_18905 [Paenibacillus polymyxa]|nr:hypothetical protein [Paenibacillus polymyxa]
MGSAVGGLKQKTGALATYVTNQVPKEINNGLYNIKKQVMIFLINNTKNKKRILCNYSNSLFVIIDIVT